MKTLSQIRAEVGARGGKKTVEKHGKEHMSKIGKKGAQAMHNLYWLMPVYVNDFALVHRKTGQVKAYLSGKPVEESEQ